MDGGTIGLLWGDREPATRGPRPSTSVPAIAAAAMAIADAEGLDAVSMARVSAELGVTKMALYRYVTDKAELLAAVIELAVGDPPDLSGIPGWRERLEEFARLLTDVWRDHPWLPWAAMGDRVMGPREVGWTECVVRALDGTGLTGAERMDASFLLFGHLRNTQSMSTAGTQAWAGDRRFSEPMREVLLAHGDRFPALLDAIAAADGAPHDNGRAFGLRRILDGLEVLIAERSLSERAADTERSLSERASDTERSLSERASDTERTRPAG